MNGVNLGTPVIATLAAGAVLWIGIWRGRRDLGLRAALGVLLAALLMGLATSLALLWWVSGARLPASLGAAPMLIVSNVLGLLATFWPVYIAANWLGRLLAEPGRGAGD